MTLSQQRHAPRYGPVKTSNPINVNTTGNQLAGIIPTVPNQHLPWAVTTIQF